MRPISVRGITNTVSIDLADVSRWTRLLLWTTSMSRSNYMQTSEIEDRGLSI